MKAEAPNMSVRSGAGSLADIFWDNELGRVQYNTKRKSSNQKNWRNPLP